MALMMIETTNIHYKENKSKLVKAPAFVELIIIFAKIKHKEKSQ